MPRRPKTVGVKFAKRRDGLQLNLGRSATPPRVKLATWAKGSESRLRKVWEEYDAAH